MFQILVKLIGVSNRRVLFVLVLIVQKQCNGQSIFAYRHIPDKYLPGAVEIDSFFRDAQIGKNGAYDLAKSLPRGYVKDGSVDYTEFLQSGLNSHSKVVFPNFPVLVNKNGLHFISNSIIIFPEGSVILMKPNSSRGYSVLLAKNVDNCKIFFPVIKGDRDNHLGNEGEWGFGIWIQGSTNISIYNPRISKCWGDGIYIGNDVKNKIVSENIKIYFPVLDCNRRNGISIVSGKNITVRKPLVANTFGTSPMSGIDIEPNNNDDFTDSISIIKPITFNNGRAGIIVSIQKILGKDNKSANIIIDTPLDEKSPYGLIISGFKSQDLFKSSISGKIQVNDPIWIDNQIPLAIGTNFQNKISVKLRNISVLKRGEDGFLIPEAKKLTQTMNILSNRKNVYYLYNRK